MRLIIIVVRNTCRQYRDSSASDILVIVVQKDNWDRGREGTYKHGRSIVDEDRELAK